MLTLHGFPLTNFYPELISCGSGKLYLAAGYKRQTRSFVNQNLRTLKKRSRPSSESPIL